MGKLASAVPAVPAVSTNYVFPCGSVNGLTLNQMRDAVKALKAAITGAVARKKAGKEIQAEMKAAAAQARIDASVAKLQARLEKALARTVKSPAQKKRAARKAGPVTVVVSEGQTANEIAASFAAKKAQKELF